MATMKVSELLGRAAGQIERNGKVAGNWIAADALRGNGVSNVDRKECAACVGGALAVQLTHGADYSPNFIEWPADRAILQGALIFLSQHLGLPDGRVLDEVIDWSDSSSQADVVAGLRGAAELARSEGS